MRITALHINGIGGISSLKVAFKANFNLICGPNGVGKTTLLECIGHSFYVGNTMLLTRNVKFEAGEFEIHYEEKGEQHKNKLTKKSFHPNDQSMDHLRGKHGLARMIISLKTTRTIEYRTLGSIARDPNKDDHTLFGEASRGIQFDDIKNWFAQREMWRPHEDGLSIAQQANLAIAKLCFSYLDEQVTFEKVSPSTFDIIVKTPQGSIYLEYLSSGYKSCICLIIGLIKEIEHRFKDPDIEVQQFDGVITIDELDLHLHPEWQAKLVIILKRVFPAAQFIASTHSPHMIQAASAGEVIPLMFDDKGDVTVRTLPSELGFQGWTVEEILTDVMGMKDLRSDQYKELVSNFDDAVKKENVEDAHKAYFALDRFLHPENELRKLFRFQIAQLAALNND